MNKIDILNAAINRNAVKSFSNRTISNDDFDFLVDIARYSPSSFGLEPWKMLVVNNREIRDEMKPSATGAQKQLDTASHFVVFTVTKELNPQSDYFKKINLDVKKMNDEQYGKFLETFDGFQKNKQDLTDERKRIDWAGKQAYIALSNMMLAAACIGIDSCPIEGFIPEDIEIILSNKGFIDTTKEHVVVMAAFGYRDNDIQYSKSRRPFNDIIKIIE